MLRRKLNRIRIKLEGVGSRGQRALNRVIRENLIGEVILKLRSG